ncbi:hypothetical protein R1flu_014688 [Riccia fluitans]|uniref:Endonuclease/exonuclease/phosphatase domain-containing protein n=1 Tax=Riccia fluitans TaxID=41844 RepID=A0ABD1YGY6_9MARC
MRNIESSAIFFMNRPSAECMLSSGLRLHSKSRWEPRRPGGIVNQVSIRCSLVNHMKIAVEETTPKIYRTFQTSDRWELYECYVTLEQSLTRIYFCMQMSRLHVFSLSRNPFRNSVMERNLCVADIDHGVRSVPVVATSHLESPCPAPPTWELQMFSKERATQANIAMQSMKELPNAVFGGDMNWDATDDGVPLLPDGWFDPWLKLHPSEVTDAEECGNSKNQQGILNKRS